MSQYSETVQDEYKSVEQREKEAEGGRWGESVGVTFMLFEFGFEARIAGDCLDFLDMAEVPPSLGESPLDGEAARLFDLWGWTRGDIVVGGCGPG